MISGDLALANAKLFDVFDVAVAVAVVRGVVRCMFNKSVLPLLSTS